MWASSQLAVQDLHSVHYDCDGDCQCSSEAVSAHHRATRGCRSELSSAAQIMPVAASIPLPQRACVHVGVDHDASAYRHGSLPLLPSPMLLFHPGGQLRRYFGRSSLHRDCSRSRTPVHRRQQTPSHRNSCSVVTIQLLCLIR